MRRWLSAGICVGVGLALGVTVAMPARALVPVPLSGTPDSLFAWSNYEWTDKDEALSAVQDLRCPTRMRKPPVSKTERLAITRAFAALAAVEGKKDVDAIRRVMKPYDVQTHRDVLLALSLGGRLGGAAAVSLHLAQKAKDREHLVNAAAMLLHLGRANEAHDLLVWADRRKPGPDPDGTGRAAYESAWGEILLRLGDAAGAKKRFEAANAAHPLSMSPRIGVARALACQGKDDEAARWWARGQRALDLPDAFEEATAEREGAPLAPDGVLPRWKIVLVEPLINPNDGIGGSKFASYEPPESADVPDDFVWRANAFWVEALTRTSDYMVQRPRMTWIQRAIERYADRLIDEDRSIGITEDMIGVQLGYLIDAADNGPRDLGCGAAENYGEYWNAVRRLYELHQDLADRRHQIYTAAAKQTLSPKVNRYFNETADNWAYRAYVDFVELLGGPAQLNGDNVSGHATWAAMRVRMNDAVRLQGGPLPYPDCKASFNGFATAEIEFPEDPAFPGEVGPCNDVTKGYNVTLDIDATLLKKLPVGLEVKAKCDTASVEVTGPPIGFPLANLTGFLGYEDNIQETKAEIFGGVKATYGLSDAAATVNVGVAFVYGMGEDGPEIIDVRIKSETAIGATDGPQGYEIKKSLAVSVVTGAIFVD